MDTNVCPYCGYDYKVSIRAKKDPTFLTGGILLIVTTSLVILGASIYLVFCGWYFYDYLPFLALYCWLTIILFPNLNS